jgi:hypothetical protein
MIRSTKDGVLGPMSPSKSGKVSDFVIRLSRTAVASVSRTFLGKPKLPPFPRLLPGQTFGPLLVGPLHLRITIASGELSSRGVTNRDTSVVLSSKELRCGDNRKVSTSRLIVGGHSVWFLMPISTWSNGHERSTYEVGLPKFNSSR